MDAAERIALHDRLSAGYIDAYVNQLERGMVQYPSEWKYSDDAVHFMPFFEGAEIPIGQLMKEQGARLDSIHEGVTMESRMYWRVYPDYRGVEGWGASHENGFVQWIRFEGTDIDTGDRVSFTALDVVSTNADGEITRWETHVDPDEFGPACERATGVAGVAERRSITFTEYYTAITTLGTKAA
jgi:hypothetical protein